MKFYQADFLAFNELNPIALIGRWDTVMFNRHLKPEDKAAQWQVLTKLPLDKSYGAIRGITDYMHSKKPCGFLIPEMKLHNTTTERYGYNTNNRSIEYLGYCDVKTYEKVRDAKSFWRFVSYMPKRNSIGFYKKARVNFPNGVASLKLLRMLAGATTGDNHQAQNKIKQS